MDSSDDIIASIIIIIIIQKRESFSNGEWQFKKKKTKSTALVCQKTQKVKIQTTFTTEIATFTFDGCKFEWIQIVHKHNFYISALDELTTTKYLNHKNMNAKHRSDEIDFKIHWSLSSKTNWKTHSFRKLLFLT